MGGRVSMWIVRARTSWSFYQKCQFGKGRDQCDGRGKTIGPEGPDFRFQLDDECAPPKKAWWSFPAHGECQTMQTLDRPGSPGCSFAAQRVRTVAAECVRARICGRRGASDDDASRGEALRQAVSFRGCEGID